MIDDLANVLGHVVGTHRQQRHGEDGRDYLRHRACAAFLAISFRRFLLSPWARAWPPLRPSATAAGSFPSWRARRSSAGRGIVETLVLGGKHTNSITKARAHARERGATGVLNMKAVFGGLIGASLALATPKR